MFVSNKNIINGKTSKWPILKIAFVSLGAFIVIAIGLSVWFISTLFAEPDLSNIPAYHHFKSIKVQEKYLAYYDSQGKEWPVASGEKYVETSFGKTFVRISGAMGKPVFVLMPSVNSSSLMWITNIKEL